MKIEMPRLKRAFSIAAAALGSAVAVCGLAQIANTAFIGASSMATLSGSELVIGGMIVATCGAIGAIAGYRPLKK